MLLVLLTVGALVSVALYSIRVVPPNIAAIGLGIIWVSLLPGVIYLVLRDRAPIPFMPVTGIFYAVFFGLPIFTIPLAWEDPASIRLYAILTLKEIRPEVLVVVFLGVAAMILSFYGARLSLWRKLPRFRLPENVKSTDPRPLLWALMIGHLAYEYLAAFSNVPSIGQFLAPVGFLAFGGFYLLWRRRLLSNPEALIILCICLPLEIFWRVKFLFLTEIILFLIFATLLAWRERQNKLIILSCVSVVLVLAAYGASTMVRTGAAPGPERLLLAGKAMVSHFVNGKHRWTGGNEGSEYYFSGRFSSLVMRTGQLWVYHIVDDRSPKPVPHWQGETYRPLFTAFIPRIIYPNKPEERVGSEFGRRYGFLSSEDLHISLNLPWITELQANFGRWGVLLGMALIGIFLAFLDRVFNSRDASDLEFVFGLTIIFPLVYPESNFSVMTGSMLPLFVSLFVYFTGGAYILKRFGWSNRLRDTKIAI